MVCLHTKLTKIPQSFKEGLGLTPVSLPRELARLRLLIQ